MSPPGPPSQSAFEVANESSNLLVDTARVACRDGATVADEQQRQR